ncbi:hypothetical protein C2857_001255 [Epichloe festucae Fl1]|uniref:VPS37 C-terminal domain-containing protein n=1 Tax=Epichloe festucae (strain Fl1) TaxID=877507 RepID=A0A7S9PUU7_EPIFF|nr:hypothetical protein C2857_001255 [Epichloe festucae Fl1]
MSSFPAGQPSGPPSSTPPAPPPKGGSRDVSSSSISISISTPPATASSPPPPPLIPRRLPSEGNGQDNSAAAAASTTPPPPTFPMSDDPDADPDPGEDWLPDSLRDKATIDLAALAADAALVNALAHAPTSSHSSTRSFHASLMSALDHNSLLATDLAGAASRLSRQRSATQAQLLSAHALERQWRQKQSDMDHALAPFSPASLYQRLARAVQEQAQVCQAMEESFLEGRGDGGGGGGVFEEREVAEWVRRYREARTLYYLRSERRERWDEGRVGGWR